MQHPLSILIVRSAWGDAYEPAWLRSLSSMGHNVKLFDTHKYFPKNIYGRTQQRLLFGPNINKVRKTLIAQIKTTNPHIVLMYQGHHFDWRTIEEIAKYAFVCGYHNDNPFSKRKIWFRYRHLIPALPYYDGFHVYRPSNVADLRSEGVKRIGILRPGFLPWIDYPRTSSQLEHRSYDSDLTFIGHYEPDGRDKYLAKCQLAGHRVQVFGNPKFWLKSAILPSKMPHHIEPVFGEEYRLALCSTKIAAVFLSKWNDDVYTRRCFEIPACRAFMLAQRTPELLQLFKEGTEAEFFSSEEEFCEKVNFYLKNEKARLLIALRGYERALSSGYDINSLLQHWTSEVVDWSLDKGKYRQR